MEHINNDLLRECSDSNIQQVILRMLIDEVYPKYSFIKMDADTVVVGCF